MQYSASESTSWLSIVEGASGNSSGILVVSCSVNDGPTRTGTVVVTASGAIGSPKYLKIVQTTCPLSMAPFRRIHSGAAAYRQPIGVTATGPWTATANEWWIAIRGDGTGTGNGTVTYDVEANGGTARAGTITVSGGGVHRTFAVYQWPMITLPGVTAEPIELGDDEHVPGFEFIHQSRETPTLRNGDAARDGLGDYTAWLDVEAGRFDFLNLVFGGLSGRGDTDIGKGAWHKVQRRPNRLYER